MMAWRLRTDIVLVAVACGACGRIGFDPMTGGETAGSGISFGGSDNDRISHPGVDAAGNLYLAGSYRAPLELGGQTYPLTGASGIYVVSFAADHSLRWVRTYTASVLVEGSRLVVASDGTTYFGGYFDGQLVLPDRSRDAAPGQDLLVLTHDADGGFQWARDYGGDWNFQTHALALARDEDGVTVGGLYLSTLPTSFGAYQLPAITFDDALMVRIDRTGTAQWATRLRSTNYARVSALDARPDGALCRGGLFEVNLDADDDGTVDLTAVGGQDAYVGVTNAAGAHVWTEPLRSAGADVVYDALAIGDECVFVGRADGAVEIGADTAGALVMRHRADGSRAWSRAFGGASTALALAPGPGGTILIGGSFTGSWQPDPAQPSFESVGGADGFVLELAGDGSVQRVHVISGTGRERVAGIHVDTDGLLVTGVFDATLATDDGVLTTRGGEDVFVLRIR